MQTIRFIAVLTFAVSLAAPAAAHDPATWYPPRYPSQYERQIVYPTNTLPQYFKGRVNDAGQEWNRLGRRLFFDFRSAEQAQDGRCQRSNKGGRYVSQVGYGPFNDPSYAVTFLCTQHGTERRLLFFQMYFNADYGGQWFARYQDPQEYRNPPGRPDVWGIATHEFGHAGGFSGGRNGGHYRRDDGTGVCSRDPQHTMCGGESVNVDNTWKYRTLEEHDVHTFAGAYGPR